MQALPEERKGELFLSAEIALWSLFPIITVISYYTLPSVLSLAWSSLFAALFFACVALYRRTWKDFTDSSMWKYTLLSTAFIGIAYYGLYFLGLRYTTPGNAALIAQFEVFTTFMFFNILRKEYISRQHTAGAALMLLGAAIVLAPNFAGVHAGDFAILAAAAFAAPGNLYNQKAREHASSETIMLLRSLIAGAFFFGLALLLHISVSAAQLKPALIFVAINGILMLGLSKIFWLEAIHRITVTKAISLATIAPLLTLLFAWIFLHQSPTLWQLASIPPFILGTLLLTDQLSRK